MSSITRHLEKQGRRDFLRNFGTAMAGISLSGIFPGDQVFGAAPASALVNPLAPRPSHFPSKAKACIYLYMYGGPSQMDLFDYKPELQKNDGKQVDMEIRRREIKKSKLLGTKRVFKQHGESGLWCSDALPNVSRHMDKLAVIKSLYMDSFAHGSANLQMNCGRILQGQSRPSGVCGDAGCPWRPNPRSCQLGERIHACGLPGHRAQVHRQSHIKPFTKGPDYP
jgi:hypothetical protein